MFDLPDGTVGSCELESVSRAWRRYDALRATRRSADEVNYSDAFAMANKHARIEQIAGDGAYGCDMCLADTLSAGVKPYFPLEASWNPKTKKHMSVADATTSTDAM